MKVFTLGHSIRSFEEFLELLKHFKIEMVVDVRRFPSSKKFPWFNKAELEKNLKKENLKYLHLEELGGYRKGGYAEFIKTEEFRKGLEKLIKEIFKFRCVILCSEFKWWKCHRKYIAQELVKKNIEVVHILTKEKVQIHKGKEVEEKMKTKLRCDRK